MNTNVATHLAAWIAQTFATRFVGDTTLTHLKLQKLCFFAAGVAWAHDAGECLRDIRFEAWKHGPVVRDLYSFIGKHSGHIATTVFPAVPNFDDNTERALTAAVDVYGSLQPWALREQSHLEAPWRDAHARDSVQAAPVAINNAAIEAHFRAKFCSGVTYPEYLVDVGVSKLDGLPFAPRFNDFFALAESVRKASASARIFTTAQRAL
jgi:uncharacterized phage-associated protein